MTNLKRYGLSDTEGWWHTIIAKDLNGDGNMDFILGKSRIEFAF